MAESYVIHICRHANDSSHYVTGQVEIEHTGYTCFFSSYDGMLHALTTMVEGNANVSLKTSHASQ